MMLREVEGNRTLVGRVFCCTAPLYTLALKIVLYQLLSISSWAYLIDNDDDDDDDNGDGDQNCRNQ